MPIFVCCENTTLDDEFRPIDMASLDAVPLFGVEEEPVPAPSKQQEPLKLEEPPKKEEPPTMEEPPKKEEPPKQDVPPKQVEPTKQEEQAPPPSRSYTVTVKKDSPNSSFGLTFDLTDKDRPVVLTTASGGLLDGKVATLDAVVGVSGLPNLDLRKLKDLIGEVSFTFKKPVEVAYSITKPAGDVFGFSDMKVTASDSSGLLLAKVAGKAAEAGIKVSDRIMAVNGEKKSPAAMADTIKKLRELPGANTVNVSILSYAD